MPSPSPLLAVLDDEPDMRTALGRLLATHGFRVGLHARAEDLLASLPTSQPACVILDLHMPGVGGLEVLAALATRGARVPVVILTGHDEAGMADRVCRLGAAAYLRKPVDEAELCAAVEAVLRPAGRSATADLGSR